MTQHPLPAAGGAPANPRIVAIDVLRGLAILWVVLFHLWTDVKLVAAPPADYYHRVAHHIGAGDWPHLPTTFGDAIFRIGFQGVPLFMMLSGLSLYLSTSRGRVDIRRFFVSRFRRVLVPYWAALGVFIAAAAGIAIVRMLIHGDGFVHEYQTGVTLSAYHRVYIGWPDAFASLALVPRVLDDHWFGVAPGSLWFVVLIVQYYALFPLLRPVLDRVGPWWFAGGALVLTLIAKWWLIHMYGGLEQPIAFRLDSGVAVFRIFDFALGMSLGYLFVHRRAMLQEYASSAFDVGGLLLLGLLLQIGGTLLDDRQGYTNIAGTPLVISGLTLLALPLIVKAPGRVEAAAPVRLLAWTGIVSYAVLIMNEPMRLVASMLRLEHIPSAAWWLFLTLVYIPGTLLLAWPFARVFGLLPPRAPAHATAQASTGNIPGAGTTPPAAEPRSAFAK